MALQHSADKCMLSVCVAISPTAKPSPTALAHSVALCEGGTELCQAESLLPFTLPEYLSPLTMREHQAIAQTGF